MGRSSSPSRSSSGGHRSSSVSRSSHSSSRYTASRPSSIPVAKQPVAPVAQAPVAQAPTLGQSMAHGASSGLGFGMGMGIGNMLFGGSRSKHESSTPVAAAVPASSSDFCAPMVNEYTKCLRDGFDDDMCRSQIKTNYTNSFIECKAYL